MAVVQPKKPAGGAFGIYMGEKRPEFAAACAGQPVTAVTKMASACWAKLSAAQKAPYDKKYIEAKAAYEKNLAAFLGSGGVVQKGLAAQRKERKMEKEGKKKKKDENAPKRPAGGGYGVFLSENREKIAKSLPVGHKMTDVGKAAGEQWRALSDDAKQPYEAKYQAKSAAYKVAMAEYSKTHGEGAGSEGEDAEEEEEAPATKKQKPVPKKKANKAGA